VLGFRYICIYLNNISIEIFCSVFTTRARRTRDTVLILPSLLLLLLLPTILLVLLR